MQQVVYCVQDGRKCRHFPDCLLLPTEYHIHVSIRISNKTGDFIFQPSSAGCLFGRPRPRQTHTAHCAYFIRFHFAQATATDARARRGRTRRASAAPEPENRDRTPPEPRCPTGSRINHLSPLRIAYPYGCNALCLLGPYAHRISAFAWSSPANAAVASPADHSIPRHN